MTDGHVDRRRHDKRDKREKRHDHDSALRGALSALKFMPAMNPHNLAPIPDEVKGTQAKPKPKPKKPDKG